VNASARDPVDAPLRDAIRWPILGLLAATLLVGCRGCKDRHSNDTGPVPVDTHLETTVRDTDGGVDTRPTDTADAADGRTADTGRETRDATDGDTAPSDIPTDTRAEAGDGTDDARDTVAATCGDGTVENGETCDDGNTESNDYCSSDCSTVTGRCGDGDLQDNESCDDGEITSGCDSRHDGGDGTCVPPGECADGYTMQDGSCIKKQLDKHVHIYISNTCQLSVSPQSVDVPRGQTVSFVYHNHSTDYAADVWMSYNGGFLGLKQGDTWNEQHVHCRSGNRPYQAYADISINRINRRDPDCPGHRMMINCN